MAASAILFPIALFIFFFFLNLPNSLDAAGFSVDLIHRDSPKSPFYNRSESLFDRVSRAIHRSNSHVNYFIPSTSAATRKDVFSTMVPNTWSYLMNISLGTPPLDIIAVMDTGSDLIWTQCIPCKSCYKQVVPVFDPCNSSTYKEISCHSSTCVNISQGCNSNGTCEYKYFYGDYDTYTNGVLASETFTMNSSGSASGRLSIPNIIFGCGHDNHGTFFSQGAGVVGLGKGPFSLISQLSSSMDKKFAYCLVPHLQNTSTSRLDFGDSAVVSGNGTFYTPLISKPDWKESFYYVNLKTISVGDTNISFPSYLNGNILLDSVTTLTQLPTWAYRTLLRVLKGAIHLQPVPDPSNNLELCYEFGKDFKVPNMTFEFDGGEVVLGSLNTLIQTNETVSCFAFWYSDPVGVFGNLAQQNINIGYDLENMKVAFKPTDCAHQ
ncbi:hypothetical protein MRB53_003633 [Persea americana]|uniref:Uncharacterized protein n=1 Tax=Persea americana TaxID=3435 RepID=A0ACC2MY86_PERAE|nr:hypothetical protein MRB53_003633 [Persea americana]